MNNDKSITVAKGSIKKESYDRKEVAKLVKKAVFELSVTWYMNSFEQVEFREKVNKWVRKNV